jgi:hypothetical protein
MVEVPASKAGRNCILARLSSEKDTGGEIMEEVEQKARELTEALRDIHPATPRQITTALALIRMVDRHLNKLRSNAAHVV